MTNQNFCLPHVVDDPVDHVLLLGAPEDVGGFGLVVQTASHLKSEKVKNKSFENLNLNFKPISEIFKPAKLYC